MQQNTFGLNRSLGGAIGAIAMVSLLSGAVIFLAMNQFRSATDARSHSTRVVRTVDDFLEAMLNQETGLRGYLISGRNSSLEPYYSGRAGLDRSIAELHALLGADPDQLERLADAEQAARAWQHDIGEAAIGLMADPATRETAIDIERRGDGKRDFDTLRARVAAIQQKEQATFSIQDAVVAHAERNAGIAIVAGIATTVLICLGVGITINRRIVRPLVRLADAMRRLANRDLSVSIPGAEQRNEVGAMARAVEVFKSGLRELDRTSLLRTTADTLPAMVGYVDADLRVGFLNGEFGRWFDFNAGDVSEVYGQPLGQVFRDAPFPGAGQELEAALAGDERRFEYQVVRQGSGRRDLEVYYRPHRGPGGAVLGVVTLLTDITDRKRMENHLALQTRDLQRTNEELEQFAYVASHDLKAPLRGIDNLVTWIEEDLEDTLTADTRTNMELLKSRVRRLESLLDDLLAYSRAGRGEIAIDRVDTKALVDELAVLVSPPEGFRITVSPALPVLNTARAPLTQTFQNLMGNAIKHHDAPSRGHIEIDAVARGAMTEFTVTDDGPGVPAQFRDRVFGMFQTLKPRDEIEGSGMGLAIVKKLVEHQGGRIWLTEGPEGRGLAVHFTWPNRERNF